MKGQVRAQFYSHLLFCHLILDQTCLNAHFEDGPESGHFMKIKPIKSTCFHSSAQYDQIFIAIFTAKTKLVIYILQFIFTILLSKLFF